MDNKDRDREENGEEEEFDRLLEEAIAGKSNYDSWLQELSGNCVKQGVSIPTGYARLRAWNNYLREQAKRKKEGERRRKLQQQLEALSAQLNPAQKSKQTEENDGLSAEELDALNQIEQDMQRRQETAKMLGPASLAAQERLFAREAALGMLDQQEAEKNEGEI